MNRAIGGLSVHSQAGWREQCGWYVYVALHACLAGGGMLGDFSRERFIRQAVLEMIKNKCVGGCEDGLQWLVLMQKPTEDGGATMMNRWS